MLCNRQTDRTRQLIGVTLDETLECLMQVKLGIDVMGNGIQHLRRLIALSGWHWVDIDGLAAFYVYRHVVLLVGHHTIVQLDICTETTTEHLAQQCHIVLLQILVHVHTRYLHEESPAVFVVVLEGYWREPCSELLLRDVLLNQTKAVVPKRLWICFHAAVVILIK